ncbi:MAG TPA: PPC domain-containing protein [Fimbriiglobus sp.]|nr:PPC domain-containing protein [Fimbriiglobus sp.]
MRLVRFILLAALVAVWGQSASAQIPQLSSRPTGAAVTLYLDFGGFNFGSGTWGGIWTDKLPGVTPAYTTDGSANFSATEVTNMREMWARTSEMYSPFNINVTTVDPAVAAGQAGSDDQRRSFYDSQFRMMHTVVGGTGSWYGGAGGISFIDVADTTNPGNPGSHTNFVFSDLFTINMVPGTFLKGIGEAMGHENGHALKLEHQSRWNGNALDREYDPGTPLFQNPGPTARAPIMGESYQADRALWRQGDATTFPPPNFPTTKISQNDIGKIMTNNGIGGYVDSGIGHTRGTATALPMTGTTIDFNLAKGVVTPNNANPNTTNPNPIGEANYTTDFYTIAVGPGGANVSVTLHSGRSTLTPGTADPGAMLDATLRLLDGTGTVLQTSASDTFAETITVNDLAAGTYFFQIASAGGFDAGNNALYFDVGSYFLTGSIVPVPEPGLVLLAGAVGLGLRTAARRRKAARAGVS